MSPTSIGALAGLMLLPFSSRSPGTASAEPRASSASKMPGSAGVVGSGPADSAGADLGRRRRVRRSDGRVSRAPRRRRSCRARLRPFPSTFGARTVPVMWTSLSNFRSAVLLSITLKSSDCTLMSTAPTARFVHGEAAADRHRLLVLVEDPEFADRDLVRLQVDARVESRVRRAEIGRRERAALDVDRAVEVRVVARARHLEVRLQRRR